MLQSVNPFTCQLIKEYEETTPQEVSEIITETHNTFLEWKNTTFEERADKMMQAARILRNNASEYGEIMTHEMGKLLKGGIGEAEKCALVCEYYASNAAKFLSPEMIEADGRKSYVTFNPLGVILAVMPWNFPFWQVFRFAAPAIMAGNAVVMKHASNVSGCAVAIEDIFRQAGFPPDLFRTLLVSSKQVDAIIENPLVKAVTLTGSTGAGIAVGRKAGAMLKKSVLELGGSDPYIILEDADLDLAVNECITSKLINSGQTCISAKRFIVVESIRREFEDSFVQKMREQKMGDPMKDDTTIAPMARHDLRDELHEQVVQSIEKGAKCLLGGQIPETKGAFYPPTVLTNVVKGMPAYDEEIFGPVAAIISVKDEIEAIEVANDSVFGLGAAVFTRDPERGERIAANELEAGCCFVNAFVRSDPRLPFGGIKESGYGRELAHYGIKEFVNIKTVFVR